MCLRCLLHYILPVIAYTFRENRDFVFWWVQIVGYVLACRLYSIFAHYTISLASLCKLIWKHWTYKMPVRYILSSVSKIEYIISVIHYTIYGAVFFSLPISLVMVEIIFCLIIIIKSEVWNVIHWLGVGHETMVCAVCLSTLFQKHTFQCFGKWIWYWVLRYAFWFI